MTRLVRNSIGLAGLLALALAASAGAAQAQTRPCKSADPTDFEAELKDCGADIYEPDPNMDPRNQRTVVVTPHQADYSSFPISSVAEFFDGLDYAQKQRVVQIAAQHGMTDANDKPMSVEDFGSLTAFMDMQMDKGGFTPEDKRRFLGELAANAHVYQTTGGRRDPTAGQDFGGRVDPTAGEDFGGGGGPRYDYQIVGSPRK